MRTAAEGAANETLNPVSATPAHRTGRVPGGPSSSRRAREDPVKPVDKSPKSDGIWH